MNFDEKRIAYYFPDKETALAFKDLLAKSTARIQGKTVLRKTLATRKVGRHFMSDSRHKDGYCVSVKAWALPDQFEIARLAKDGGSISPPHS